MKIHILSDIHLELAPFSPVVTDADIVILAGDIDVKGRGVEWAKSAFSGPCLYVPGNHEYYNGHLDRSLEKLRAAADDRVRVLDQDEVIFGGVRFLGATGWTGYTATDNLGLATWDAKEQMRDFKKIRVGPSFRKPRPADFAEASGRAKAWLTARLAEPFDGPTVVVTHHAPSMKSLGDSARSHLDASYANAWDDLMGPGVALWVHGHTHVPVDYDVAGTRVVSNPRGYPGEDTHYDPELVLDLGVETGNFLEADMKATPEHALLGLVRGQIGSLAGPRGHYGHALAVETAVEVAKAGGEVFLITPLPPDAPDDFDSRLVVDYCPNLPGTGADWHRYLHHHLRRLRHGELPSLLLVVIDHAVGDDVIEVLKELAEWHSVAIAYLPPPMAKEAR